uniref:Uncharacterized protein n=1 Tax=Erpetoichthys calabaricus TaxID=27687 RepID=A0A8C4XDD4_ERPCA
MKFVWFTFVLCVCLVCSCSYPHLSLNPHSLFQCGLPSTCCSALASALSSPHSQLTELDLHKNNIGDSGVDQLCEGLRSKNCKLEKLK